MHPKTNIRQTPLQASHIFRAESRCHINGISHHKNVKRFPHSIVNHKSRHVGGASLLSNSTLRQTAIRIGNTESYHAAVLRTLLFEILDTTPAYNKTVGEIVTAIVEALNSLTGTPQLRFNLVDDGNSSLANVDSKGDLLLKTMSHCFTNSHHRWIDRRPPCSIEYSSWHLAFCPWGDEKRIASSWTCKVM